MARASPLTSRLVLERARRCWERHQVEALPPPDFALYRPLLEGARDAQLPALALNAPRELTRKIEVVSLITAFESELSLPGFNASGYDLLVVFEDRASVK